MAQEIQRISKLPKYDVACHEAIKRFSCVTTFAVCPADQEESSSYLPPCRLQCKQIEAICDIKSGGFLKIPQGVDLNSVGYDSCDQLPDMNCALNLPKGYFAISPRQGDYAYIATIYIVLCVLWSCLAIYWNYAVYVKYLDNCALICRLISIVPVIKSIVMIIGVGFWQTCTDFQMCSFWLQVALVNTHLIYETAIMISLLLIALGWTITRHELEAHDWRGVIGTMTSFYIGNSVVLVVQATTKDHSTAIVANAIIYVATYVYIVFSASIELKRVNSYVKMLQPQMASEFTAPLKFKREMFIVFMLMTFLSITAEATTQIIVASYEGVGPFIAIYEMGNFVSMSVIGYYFRPRPFSPFFFMEPATSPNNTAGVGGREEDRLLTMIKAVKSGTDNLDVELNPLVPAQSIRNNPCQTLQQRILSTGSRLMVLQDMNNDVSIGVCSSVGERAFLRDVEIGGGSKKQRVQNRSRKVSESNGGNRSGRNETADYDNISEQSNLSSSSRNASVQMVNTVTL